MGQLDLDLRFVPGRRAPEAARRGLEALRSTFDDATVDDAVLLVSELVTNSVRHAGLGAADTICVEVRQEPSMLHVEVADPGAGFPVDPVLPRADGGWGLLLLDRVADRWGVRRDPGTIVWFELDAVSPPSDAGSEAPSDR
jgi:anti-sigma regulatory factor (Ser/Thr protein kinase)